MLYVAFVKMRNDKDVDEQELVTRSHRWWNEGERPPGIKTVAFFGTLGTTTSDVYVFEADDPMEIRRMISYWRDFDWDLHPAVDLAEVFRRQGMAVG